MVDEALDLDSQSAERLKSLGYVGGAIQATSLDVDPKGDDPKDFIDYHKAVTDSRVLFTEGKKEEARIECLKILKKRPLDLAALQILGDIELEEGRNADAESRYLQFLAAVKAINASSKRTVQMHSEIGNVHYNLGNAVQNQGRSEDALDHFQEAIRFKPELVEAHYSLGKALEMLGRPENALARYREALRHKPGLVEAHNNLGLALQTLGRVEDSLAHYRQAIRLRPDYADAHDNLGLALQALGRFEDAVKHYHKSLQVQSDRFVSLNNLAWILATCGSEEVRNGRQAVELAKRAAGLTSHQNPSILGTLLVAYAEAGNFEQAVRWQEKAIQIAPDEQKAVHRERLELYKQGKPFRDPRDKPLE